MSKSKHQYHPYWRSKQNRKSLKFKKFKLRPYGLCIFCNYGNEYFKHSDECNFTKTNKGVERKLNKLNIYNNYDS